MQPPRIPVLSAVEGRFTPVQLKARHDGWLKRAACPGDKRALEAGTSRIRFEPVILKQRHDGWTPERQFRFIEELAATRSVSKACRAVGMSRDSAYKLREKDCRGQSEHATRERPTNGFAWAWTKALEPDSAAERHRSPHALRQLNRLDRSKDDKARETRDPSISPAGGTSASSALSAFEALLDRLRAQDLQPPFDGG